MNEYLYHNKISFLTQKERKVSYIFWISIFLCMIIWSSCIIKIRFSYKVSAVYDEEKNVLQIYWSYENINLLNKIEKVRVEETEIPFQVLSISEIKINEINQTNYQIVEISSPKKYQKNQMINIKLLDNKEKIIKKAKKIILGG